MIGFIADNYDKKISLADIASSANISKSEALRCFKSCLHTTPFSYLNEYRLDRASEMLRQKDKNITQVAMLCGFESSGYFGKMFKRKFCMTAKEYTDKSG